MREGDFRLEQRGHVVTISLSRIQKRNALTLASLAQLKAMAETLSDNVEARAVIIRADGDDFSVGMDLGATGSDVEHVPIVQARRSAQLGAHMLRAIREIHQPTICAIRGVATGGATCIATACDFRVGVPSAQIGYGEVKLGINLMWNALPLAVQTVGPVRAKRMVMTGALFDAATMLDWGFFDELVSEADLDSAALRLAETYCALPPIAVQMIKRSVNAYAGAVDAAVMHADADQWLLGTETADFHEARSAFFERRAGRFTGN